jgi:hypothetical protein
MLRVHGSCWVRVRHRQKSPRLVPHLWSCNRRQRMRRPHSRHPLLSTSLIVSHLNTTMKWAAKRAVSN